MRRAWLWAAMMTFGATTAALSQGGGRDVSVPASMPNGTLICGAGETLVIAGPDTARDFARCVLSADRHPLPGQSQDADPLNPYYSLRWSATDPGTHRLSLDYVMLNGTVTNARRFVVQVEDRPPVVFDALPGVFYGASQGKDLPVAVVTAPGFRPVQVRYFLDGAPVEDSSAAPFGCVLPLGGVLTGPHSVCLQATDVSGDIYISPVQTVNVLGGSAPGAEAKMTPTKQGSEAVSGHSVVGKKPARKPKHRPK